MSNNIHIIGPFPPPYGGVSVHIARLADQLPQYGFVSNIYCQHQKENKIPPNVIPAKYEHFKWQFWLFENRFLPDSNIIHCHDGLRWSPGLLLMLLLKKKVVVTIHDQMVDEKWNNLSLLSKCCAKILFRSSNTVFIAVSKNVKDKMDAIDTKIKNMKVIPAYLPPQANTSHFSLPQTVSTFIDSHNPTLSIYGVRFSIDKDGLDLYGFDLTIQLLKRLKTRYKNIGLVILVPGFDAKSKVFTKINSLIKRWHLEKSVLIYTTPILHAYQLWRATDIYIRPTTTDGDAVAIREALATKTPVVASDAAYRPPEAIIFKSRNINDLTQVTKNVLENLPFHKNRLQGITSNTTLMQITSIYKRLTTN